MKTFLSAFKAMLNNNNQGGETPDTSSNTAGIAVGGALVSPIVATGPSIIDATAGEGYLVGQLLVATPLITSGCFQKSVVFVFAHNNEGAMGVIVNQPMELMNYTSLVEGMNLPDGPAMKNLPIHFGGPVERGRGFVLHSADYYRDFSLARAGDVAITASAAILNDIANGKGPKNATLIVGYAGWGPGQLEQEIESNSWISVPTSAKIVFGSDNDMKWVTASESLGVNMAFFSTTVGHA